MNLSVPEYVTTALKWLADEKRWGQKYYRLSYIPVIKQIEFEIINQVAETLANNNESGVLDMLQKGKRQDLMNIYQLYSRVE
jgi:hypothetical protein